MNKKKFSKKHLGFAIKFCITIIAVIVLYKQLFQKINFEILIYHFEEKFSNIYNLLLLLFVILLMLLNWSVETFKWQFMIKKIIPLKFKTSLKAVLSGVAVSVATPNRMGEFGGRIFFLPTHSRIKGILITLLGSFSKYALTLFAGSVAFVAFVVFYNKQLVPKGYFYSLFAFLVLLNTIVFSLFFFSKHIAYQLNKTFKKKKFSKYFLVFKLFSTKELFTILLFSLFRIIIYSFQFYILLILFDIKLPILQGFLLISLIFFINTILPSIAWTEVFVRTSVAIYIGSFLNINEINISYSTSVLWLINIVIPAILGIIYVQSIKIFKNA